MEDNHPASTTPTSLEDRLRLKKYSDEACFKALHGKAIPFALGYSVTRTCVLRGIRYHYGFGTELRNIPNHPEFTRALNARDIMSNIIPDMNKEHEFPYCIWYPDVATEETYRTLAKRYEGMRYQVGRACAVAGYVDLWKELDLLPEVAIAEEARDNDWNGRSGVIFNEIIESPIKYAIMNDYDRTVNTPRPGACLNADTAVRSSLQAIHRYQKPYDLRDSSRTSLGSELSLVNEGNLTDFERIYSNYEWGSNNEDYWNITEDWCISDHGLRDDKLKDTDTTKILERTPEPKHKAVPGVDERVVLFYSPLPVDLPNINKDLLIMHAAYSGNIDRYVRLRRPKMAQQEYSCIIRGIYHSTMFAKWWSLQPHSLVSSGIAAAITARFIMNNDLSRITEGTYISLPDLIHHPNWAHSYTYAELVRRQPEMTLAVGKACIVTNDEDLFKTLKFEPRDYDQLTVEAMRSHNPYYLEHIRQNVKSYPDDDEFYGQKNFKMVEIDSTSTQLMLNLDGYYPSDEQDGEYNGQRANFSALDLFVCAPEEMRIPGPRGRADLGRMYRESCFPEEKKERETAQKARDEAGITDDWAV